MKVLVTGANGQLGKCIKDASASFSEMDFIFVSREELDISNEVSISKIFSENNFDYCINTAAYTNVEKAESDADNAFLINAEAVKNLAKCCKDTNTVFIQISTDYVFDGKKTSPYTEDDTTNPINVYGASKLKGEQYVQDICKKYFIIRTSWLYSQYGHNFYNTVLRFAKENRPLTVTTEQTGTPTNANDLAENILQIIKKKYNKYEIYNVSNTGKATWYDFAEEILIQANLINTTTLAKTDFYRTFAKRPKYSVLTLNKSNRELNVALLDWRESLKKITTNEIN